MTCVQALNRSSGPIYIEAIYSVIVGQPQAIVILLALASWALQQQILLFQFIIVLPKEPRKVWTCTVVGLPIVALP